MKPIYIGWKDIPVNIPICFRMIGMASRDMELYKKTANAYPARVPGGVSYMKLVIPIKALRRALEKRTFSKYQYPIQDIYFKKTSNRSLVIEKIVEVKDDG